MPSAMVWPSASPSGSMMTCTRGPNSGSGNPTTSWDAGARGDRGLDLGRIDVGAAAQHHVGETVAEIEIAVRIQPADVAERLPAITAALGLGAEIVVGGVLPSLWKTICRLDRS